MNTSIVWNYEDIDANLLVVDFNGEPIGYFRIDKDDFVVITDHNHDYPTIPIAVLSKIVNGYDKALEIAHKIKNEGGDHESK